MNPRSQQEQEGHLMRAERLTRTSPTPELELGGDSMLTSRKPAEKQVLEAHSWWKMVA